MNASRKPVMDGLVKRQKAFLDKISGDTVKEIEKILKAEKMTVPTNKKPVEKAHNVAKQPFTNAELIEKIREAHIAMTSGHLADAIAYLAVVVNSVPPYRVLPAEDAARKVTPACTSKDPDKMCEKCNCWKMTRAYCS